MVLQVLRAPRRSSHPPPPPLSLPGDPRHHRVGGEWPSWRPSPALVNKLTVTHRTMLLLRCALVVLTYVDSIPPRQNNHPTHYPTPRRQRI